MNSGKTRWLMPSLLLGVMVLTVGATASMGITQYNNLQMRDEAVSASWAEVLNMYRRRADLLPNVIATVQGYAQHERTVLLELTEARNALLQGLQTNDQDMTALRKLAQAQQKYISGMRHLLAMVERYPELKANTLFQELIVELEGSENRVAYARSRYIGAVSDYNLTVRSFPGNMIASHYGFKPRPNLQAASALEALPVKVTTP